MTSISILALTISLSAQANIYKWTDSKGVTHYSATPPPQKSKVKQKAENIEDEIRFAAGKHRPKGNVASTNATGKEDKTAKRKIKLSAPDKKLVSFCKQQRGNLSKLKNNFRNQWVDSNGTKTMLNQDQRKSKVDEIMTTIDKNCEGV